MPLTEKQADFVREMRGNHTRSKTDLVKQIKDTESLLVDLNILLERTTEAESLVTNTLKPLLDAYDQDHFG